MNECHLMGNLTRDPELNTLQSGKRVVKFGLALNRKYKDSSGNWQNEPSFIECEAWDTGADTISKYFKKGSPIIVHASVKQDRWEDKEGNNRSTIRFRVNKFEFLPGGKRQENSNGSQDDSSGMTNSNGSDEEIPF